MNFRQEIRKKLPESLIRLIRFLISGQIGMQTAFSRKGINSDLTDNEWCSLLAYLLDMERDGKTPKYLEIGVFSGGTIKFLKDRTTKTHFTGIDLFEDFKSDQKNTHVSGTYPISRVQQFLGRDVKLIKGESKTVLFEQMKAGSMYDMIFIDGNHTYDATKDDFQHAVPLLKDGGYLAFHNCSTGMAPDYLYIMRDGGPWKVTQEIKTMKQFKLEHEVDRIRIFKNVGS